MENNDILRNEEWRDALRKSKNAKERTSIARVKMPELSPEYRITCKEEVNQGITEEMAVIEASRCLDCPNPQCVTGCPVNINIPTFIKNVERGNFAEALSTIKETSALPAVCGRVCPQEKQCESKCMYHKMGKEPVAIGYLERFVADYGRTHAAETKPAEIASNGIKVAVVGSGPAGLSFAGDMAKRGYEVTVFEALHEIGGVLKYGIPEFRLPNAIVDTEIDGLAALGVKFIKDCIVGKTITYDDLHEEGFKGIFVASGAGLPRFMGIPGENLNGIMSSNEYLTRINLMGADSDEWDTPVLKGENVAIIGGGNTAMDSVRTARRMGAEVAMIVYRRGEDEMPARVEEVKHAKEEGVEFMTLHNPIEYRGDENGRILGFDAITPHGEDLTKNPVPIKMIKILPDVVIEFSFRLNPSKIGEYEISPEEKTNLFKEILCTFGIGAKTNVGYGVLESYNETELAGYKWPEKNKSFSATKPTTEKSNYNNNRETQTKSIDFVKGEIYEAVVNGGNEKKIFIKIKDKPYKCFIYKDRVQAKLKVGEKLEDGDKIKVSFFKVDDYGNCCFNYEGKI